MIREMRESDAPGVAQVIRETAPAWVTSARGIVHRLRTNPEQAQRRNWVAEADGEIAGRASAGLETGSDRDDVGALSLLVRPAWRGAGLGAALYDVAAAHLEAIGARRVLAGAAQEPVAQAFADRRGFRHTMTRRLSRIDPRDVDGALVELREEKAAEGFALASFADLADQRELIYAVDAEAGEDEPADEPTVFTLDEWLARFWAAPDLSHEGSFAVCHDGRPVTITALIVDHAGGRAMNAFTGSLRAYRGRGLARLAKLASIEWAAARGMTSIVNENDETNGPMLAINVRLGYRPFATWLAYVREPA